MWNTPCQHIHSCNVSIRITCGFLLFSGCDSGVLLTALRSFWGSLVPIRRGSNWLRSDVYSMTTPLFSESLVFEWASKRITLLFDLEKPRRIAILSVFEWAIRDPFCRSISLDCVSRVWQSHAGLSWSIDHHRSIHQSIDTMWNCADAVCDLACELFAQNVNE